MVIKVQVLDVQDSSSSNIKYGLVVEEINKEFFNRGRITHVFDVELLNKLIIPNKTILQYTGGAVLANENVTIIGEDDNPIEITYSYVFLSEHVLGIQYIEDGNSDGNA